MRLFLIELKQYVSMSVALPVIAGIVMLAGVYAVVNAGFTGKAITTGFTLPVVDMDNSSETNLLISIFNEQEGLSSVIRLEKAGLDEAADLVATGKAPGYVFVPEGFANDVKYGVNTPIKFVYSRSKPIESAVSTLLLEAGTAFLSASQAGVYAAYDYAFSRGMAYEEIDRVMLFPINAAFLTKILNYQDFFKTITVDATGGLSLGLYYAVSIGLFFVMINMFTLSEFLTIDRGAYAMLRIAGLSRFRQLMLKFAGLAAFNCLLMCPLIALFGIKALAALWVVSAFMLMAAVAFGSDGAGLFMFAAALIMLFASGGIVPVAYLPPVFATLRFLTVNYWVLSLNNGLLPCFVLVALGCVFLAAAYATCRIKTR